MFLINLSNMSWTWLVMSNAPQHNMMSPNQTDLKHFNKCSSDLAAHEYFPLKTHCSPKISTRRRVWIRNNTVTFEKPVGLMMLEQFLFCVIAMAAAVWDVYEASSAGANRWSNSSWFWLNLYQMSHWWTQRCKEQRKSAQTVCCEKEGRKTFSHCTLHKRFQCVSSKGALNHEVSCIKTCMKKPCQNVCLHN